MVNRRFCKNSIFCAFFALFLMLLLCACSKNAIRSALGTDSVCSSRLSNMTVRYGDGTLSYKTRYIYDGKGRLKTVVHIPEVFFDGLYGIWRYAYKGDYLQEFKWVDTMGTKYSYDEAGRLVSAYECSEGEYKAEYTISYDENGRVSEVVVDSNYRPDDPERYTYVYYGESARIMSDHSEYNIEYRYGYSHPMVLVVSSDTQDSITVFAAQESDNVVLCDTWLVNNIPVPVIYCDDTDRITFNSNGLPVKAENDYGRMDFKYR